MTYPTLVILASVLNVLLAVAMWKYFYAVRELDRWKKSYRDAAEALQEAEKKEWYKNAALVKKEEVIVEKIREGTLPTDDVNRLLSGVLPKSQ